MSRWQAFEDLCGHLRAGLLGDGSPEWRAGSSWDPLVELASRHNVLPALAWSLKDAAALPTDLRGYFAAVLMRNEERNARLLDDLARVTDALNAIDIEPVLLKGAAHLVEGIYPASELRVMRDLDLLVPEEREKHAVAALADLGFVAAAVPLPDDHLHLPLMYDRETEVQVEIHTRVEQDAERAIVPAAWFCSSTRAVPFRGRSIRLPDATCSVAHNIVHSQIDDQCDRLNRIELRPLLDLAILRARHESAIDWAEIDDRFDRAGFADALATCLQCAELFFAQPMPRLRGRPRPEFFPAFRTNVERTERPRRRRAPPRRLEQVTARRVARFAGRIDDVVRSAGMTMLRGWAVDFTAKAAARSVQLFVNGRHAAAALPEIERQDVAAALGLPEIDKSGFQLAVNAPVGEEDVVQVFAELRGDVFAELRRPEAEAAEREQRMSEAQAEIRRLAAEVHERDRRLAEADAELRRLIAELGARDRRLAEADAELRRMIEDAGERNRRLDEAGAEVRRVIAELGDRDRRLAEADAGQRRLIVALGERDQQLAEAEAGQRRLTAALKQRDQQLAEAEADQRGLTAALGQRDQRLAEVDADLRRLIAEVGERDQRLAEADAGQRQLITEMGDRDQRLDEAGADLCRLTAALGERERRLAEADADLRRRIAELAEREQRLTDADAELRRLIAELGEREQRLTEADTELRRLIAELGERDRRLIEADAEHRRLIAALGERERRLTDADADGRRLIATLGEREQQLAKVALRLQRFERSLLWRIVRKLSARLMR